MSRPLFQLGPRLALCAQLVRGGYPLCDVGTDHAYLPIWLLKSGKVPQAVACDLREGPLAAAAANARRYQVEDRLALRLSDGLRAVAPEEGDDLVLAGMGGELILRIVGETPWLRDPAKRLVLQPMRSAPDLRRGLAGLGFQVLEEWAAQEGGRVYTAFSAQFVGGPLETDPLYPYIGKLRPGAPEASRYAENVLRDLAGRLEGARRGRGQESPERLAAVMEAIRETFGRDENA